MTAEFTVAVHALTFLSHNKTRMSSEAIAQNVCTNPARIRKVMAVLTRAGLTETRDGSGGGYLLAKPAAEIPLSGVAEALGEHFVAANWRSGDPHMECLIASGMAGVLDGLYAEMDGQCRRYLADITVADIERRIFGKTEG